MTYFFVDINFNSIIPSIAVCNHRNFAGLPSLVPSVPGSLGPISSSQYPFSANVHNRRHQKINSKSVAIIALSAVVLVLMSFGICIIWKYKGFEKSRGTGRVSNSSATRKTGNFWQSWYICYRYNMSCYIHFAFRHPLFSNN